MEDKQPEPQTRFAMPMNRWRLFLVALTAYLLVWPLEAMHSSMPARTVVIELSVLAGCALSGWMLTSALMGWKRPMSQLASALVFITPLIVLAVVLGLVMQVQYGGEAILLFLGFALLRASRPEPVKLLPETAREWAYLLVVLVLVAATAAFYWQNDTIANWWIARRMGDLRP